MSQGGVVEKGEEESVVYNDDIASRVVGQVVGDVEHFALVW
jgi:hypothetical protein